MSTLVTAKSTGYSSRRDDDQIQFVRPGPKPALDPGIADLLRSLAAARARERAKGGRGGRRPPARGKAAAAAARKAARKVMARIAARAALRVAIPLAVAPTDLLEDLFRRFRQTVAPTSFPGFAHMQTNGAWGANHFVRPDHGTLVLSPGDYMANGFDTSTEWGWQTGNYDGMLDMADGSAISGFRYWGHVHWTGTSGDPYQDQTVAADWPQVDVWAMPESRADPNSRTKIPDLTEVLEMNLPAVAPSVQIDVSLSPPYNVDVRLNAPAARPPKGTKENKKVYGSRRHFIMMAVLNAFTEILDAIDVVAEAAGYNPRAENSDWLGFNTPQSKLIWLFFFDGIENAEMWDIIEGLREEAMEDLIYGRIGRFAGQASRDLGLTVGLQSGPLL